jgi:hypothetical protein
MERILLLCIVFGVSSAQAALFQGNSSGTFVNPTGPAGVVLTGVGTDSFTWGDGSPFLSPSSSLGYAGTSFDNNENDAFNFGTLSYFNGTISSGTGATSVDLSVKLNFTSPSALIESFMFDLALINSPNTSDPNASADIVNFDNTVSSNFFSFGGTDYTLEFLGFGTLSGAGFTIEDSFRVLESENASVNLIGRITSTPGVAVPEPSILVLFGVGLLGLGFARRRQS